MPSEELQPTSRYIIEKAAEAIYNTTFVDKYQDLPINGIEREMARQQAKAALKAAEQERQEGCIYKHYKGGKYIKLHEGYIESDGAQVVIYKSCKTGEVWVRPIDEFNAKFSLPNPPIELKQKESDNAE